jgi:glycosyltransferase involved in cell wall biosynthesis
MKVMFVINGLGTGGAERSLAEMLPTLASRGVEASVVCLHRRAEGVERSVMDAGFDVRFLSGRRLPTRALELRRLLQEIRPELVHTSLLESSLAGRVAARRTGVPVLTSLVNTPYVAARLADPNLRKTALAAVRVVDSWTARHMTDHFHAITGAVKDAAVETMGVRADRVTVIERGRDPVRLGEPGNERRRRARAALGLGDDVPVVVAVGRQEFQKGHRFLLEATPALAAVHPHVTVLIAGRRGHMSNELEGLAARPDVAPHVRLLGFRDDLPEVLSAADVFAFPSLFEGLGGSVIEAMALGLPVVGSDLPALREILEVGVNAELVPVSQPAPLAAALAGVLSDRERAVRMGERSRQLFVERFTLERSADRMVALYHQVVAARRRG